MPSFRSLALFIVVSFLSDKNNCWIASAAGASLRGDNKNDNTDVDQGNGYEIAHGSLPASNPTIWHDDWKRSPGHNNVNVENPPSRAFMLLGLPAVEHRSDNSTWFGTEYDPQSNHC
mmetsp:Transcript_42586/g.43347  ORF Transcript_42586/g.43347 Transcript_42586/m.43347 type:complete len:117 (+) Transcript_42586:375-725(+)